MSRKSGALTYPEPLGPPWPVVGDLYLYLCKLSRNISVENSVNISMTHKIKYGIYHYLILIIPTTTQHFF